MVRANINSMPGSTPQPRMRACAAAYKSGKRGSGMQRGPAGTYHGQGVFGSLFDTKEQQSKRNHQKIMDDANARFGKGVRKRKGKGKQLEGEGFFSNLWDGIKKAVKIVGPIASMIPGPVGMVAKAVTAGSKLMGNGFESQHMPPRVKRHLRAMVGGSVLQSAAQAQNFGYDSVMQAVQSMA